MPVAPPRDFGSISSKDGSCGSTPHGAIMYPIYPDTPEGRAREALEHPDGEEYAGAHDWYKDILAENGWDEEEIERCYGKRYGDRNK